ncbi:MAG: 50S ribosomal protein L10 [Candidatus Verstraetearchaeota archaeon]|nr:50S ribosomal protein L10 [Candidatus Verstraetearchaeota archaeon]
MKATLLEKQRKVERLKGLMKEYPVFAIADLKGMKANQLQLLKKKFKDDMEIKVSKNTLIARALKEIGIKDYEEIEKYLSGPNAFVFSKKNPFKLYFMFEKNKVESAASPGEIAPNDIVVTAGNTGLQPGPILSKFGAAKIPTKIQDGTVWIAKDTTVVEKGSTISADVADLLSKLGLKPILVGLRLRMAYDGTVIPGEMLAIDLDDYRSKLSEAAGYALNLSVNAAYPTKETVQLIVAKAYRDAKGVAVEAGFVTPETIGDLVAVAAARGRAVAAEASKRRPELNL